MSSGLHAALSRCNLAAVQCTSETELFSQVCQALLDSEEISSCWIGLVGQPSKQVVPVAAAGRDIESLSRSLISLEYAPDIDAALSRGKPYFGKDCITHPEQSDWHQRIGRMGCDAFALLPLTTHDQPVGVLCISCESAEQLRGNVPELLLSISTFVSFALDAFATESDRRRVQQEHEAALALSEKYRLDAENTQKHLVSVINRVNDGMTAMDRDWNYTFVNQQAARMLRHDSPEDLIGKCIWDIYPDGIGKSFHQACEQAFRTQQPGIYEEYYREHDRWFENRIFPSAEGWTIYFSDITDRKKTELALRDAATAFANIRDAVMVADENLSIIRINPAFSRITGFSDAEAIGTSAQILNCGKGTGTFERIMSSLSSQGHWQGRASIGRKCGDVFPAWLTANAIEQSSDTSGHFVVVFSDLSDDIQHSFTPASVSHS